MVGIKHKATKVSGEKGLATEWNDDHEQTGNHDVEQHQFLNNTIENRTDFPAGPVKGQIIFRTDLNTTYIYNGADWDVASGGVPIGSVSAWLKSFPNTPVLPTAWVECNGQVLDDAESVFDGQTIPDLNGSAGAQRFLRGDTTSGGTGGTETHEHTVTVSQPPTHNILEPISEPTWWDEGARFTKEFRTAGLTIDAASTLPSYYEVVWIMKVK